jgi:hypothetical protein
MNASPPPSRPDLALERVREQLAARFGIVVSADDPILATVALNDIVLDHHAERVEHLLRQHARRIDEADAARLARQRDLAKTVIGDALREAKTALHQHANTLAQHRGPGPSSQHPSDDALWRTVAVLATIAAVIGWSGFLFLALA